MNILWGLILLVILLLVIKHFVGTNRVYITNQNRIKEEAITTSNKVITVEDLETIPQLIAGYLRYVGVVGKQKVTMFEADIIGEMKLNQIKEWAPIKAKQTTSLNQSIRLFYITMRYNGLPINGLHHFEAGEASMVIKILDLIKVADNRGLAMNQAETVTYFNDLCIFAPSALIDADIVWEEIDDRSIKGTFTNKGVSVSAILSFDEEGKLINFISNDRYAIEEDGSVLQVPWSTPIEAYDDFHGYRLVSKGEAIWHYLEGDFCYIRMTVNDVVY